MLLRSCWRLARAHPRLQPGLQGPRVARRSPEGREICFWKGHSRSLLRPWVLPGSLWLLPGSQCHSQVHSQPGQEGLSLPCPRWWHPGTPWCSGWPVGCSGWPPWHSLALGQPQRPLAVAVLQQDGEQLPAPPAPPLGNGALGRGEGTFSNLPRFQFLPVPVWWLQLWAGGLLQGLPRCPGVSPHPGRALAQPPRPRRRRRRPLPSEPWPAAPGP